MKHDAVIINWSQKDKNLCDSRTLRNHKRLNFHASLALFCRSLCSTSSPHCLCLVFLASSLSSSSLSISSHPSQSPHPSSSSLPPPPLLCLLCLSLSLSLSKWVSSGVLAGRNHLRANTLLSVVKASPQIPFYTHKCHFPFVCTLAALAEPSRPRASSQTRPTEEN